MVPMKIVPTSETASTIVVLMKPSSICPLTNAVTKLSKLSQFSGGVKGLVCAYSGAVLSPANSSTDSGRIVTIAATTRLVYFAVVALPDRRRSRGERPRIFFSGGLVRRGIVRTGSSVVVM